MDWKTVQEKISQHDRTKWDRQVSGRQLQVDNHGVLELIAGGGHTECYALSDLATGQMCQRVGIPAAYYRRLLGGTLHHREGFRSQVFDASEK